MRVGLVQINMGFTWSALLPYSVGLLQAYADAHAAEQHEFLLPLYKRVPVDEAVAHLRDADVVGFSAYVWNEKLSLEIARRLKEVSPATRIVFGGPQVPDRSEPWLRAHPFVDVAVHGEGEAVFTSLLDGRDDTPGISYLDDAGAYVLRPRATRITDMTEIPSPFLTDVFKPLMEANPAERWVMMWETNRGCPFSCTFCDWGSATQSKVYRFDDERIYGEIDWMARNEIFFVFCCDANFGMLKRDQQIAETIVATKEQHGWPKSLSVQSTKNATDRAYAIQKLLNDSLNAYGATLALQSTNPQTLANIRRENISSDTYVELQRRFSRDGVYTYTDIILGLPGETYGGFADSIGKAIADGQHNHVQFHNCSLLANAEMADPAYVERFGIRTVPQLIRNPHTPVSEANEVEEYLPTVIATDAMPEPDWVRAKTYWWLVDLFYFDRLLQLPLALLEAEHGVPLRTAIEALAAAESPVLADVARRLRMHARAIQLGGPEFVDTPAYGDLVWPADQHALVSLVLERKLDAFYEEAADVLAGLCDGDAAVAEAVELNAALLRVPFRQPRSTLFVSHPLLEYHQALVQGAPVALEEELVGYVIDRTAKPFPTVEAWFEHLVWCHGKDKRGYLNEATTTTGQRSRVLST